MVAVAEVRLLMQHGHARALRRLQRGGRQIYRGPENPGEAGRGQPVRQIHGHRGEVELQPPPAPLQRAVHRGVAQRDERGQRTGAAYPRRAQHTRQVKRKFRIRRRNLRAGARRILRAFGPRNLRGGRIIAGNIVETL